MKIKKGKGKTVSSIILEEGVELTINAAGAPKNVTRITLNGEAFYKPTPPKISTIIWGT
jgi:hypothetical protein